MTSPALTEIRPAFATLFPATRYFEIDSRVAGVRFGAWVTPPMAYDADPAQRFPVVYQVDGNLFFPATAPFHQAGAMDPMSPLRPFILVSVGYSEREKSDAWTWLRVRDFLPPGEAVPEVMRQAAEASVQYGKLSREEADRYLAMFDRPAADKFLAFMETELHPLLSQAYRVDDGDTGLWGDSYGGLFAVYAALRRTSLFKTVGAGSPGIVGDSQVWRLYDQASAAKADFSGRRLHVTLAARELTDPGIYQSIVARGTSELLARTSQTPLPGLQVTSEIIPLESHLTGGVGAWFSFLRTCYGRKG